MTIFAFDEITGSQIAVSGIEAQIGILHYMMENFELALDALRSTAGKIKDGIGKTTALLGMNGNGYYIYKFFLHVSCNLLVKSNTP